MKTYFHQTIFILFLLCTLLCSNKAVAQFYYGGVAGMDMQYQCTGTPGIYNIIVKIFRDCSGAQFCPNCGTGPMSPSCAISINIGGADSSYNNVSFGNQTLFVITAVSGYDVVQMCNAVSSICGNCGNRTPGTYTPGIEVYVFQGQINLNALPSACCLVRVSYTNCCRNSAISTIINPSGTNYYSEMIINRCASPCNSAPTFTNNPVIVVCTGQDVSYNLGALDPDGDSLSYALGASLTGHDTLVPYAFPFNAAAPFLYLGFPATGSLATLPSGIYVNSYTGDVFFRPLGIFISNLVIEVKQWKTIGGVPTLMGLTRRDINIYSKVCPTAPPLIIKKYDTLGTYLGNMGDIPDTVKLCTSQSFCRNFVAADTLVADTTDFETPFFNGSNFTFVPLYNPALRSTLGPRQDTYRFCWTAPQSADISKPFVLNLRAKSRSCVVGKGKIIRTLIIYVPPLPTATIHSTYIAETGNKRKFTYTRNNTLSNNPNNTQWKIETAPGTENYNVISADSIDSYAFTNRGVHKIKLLLQSVCGTTVFDTTVHVGLLYLGSKQNISCKGNNSGEVILATMGTLGQVQYKRDSGAYQSSDVFGNLLPGNYLFYAKDTNSVDTLRIGISEPATLLQGSLQMQNTVCNGAKGSAVITVTGGNTPYLYRKDSGAFDTLNTFNNLTAGNYHFTIKDSNTCALNLYGIITELTPLSVQKIYKNVTCNGFANGEIKLLASGSTPPYLYKMGAWFYDTISVFRNLNTGNYTFSIKDSSGCISNTQITITQPTSLNKISGHINATCLGAFNGKAYIYVSGGTKPYRYNWSTIPAQNTDTVVNLPAGIVKVQVFDSNNCVINDSIFIGYKPIYNGQEICGVTSDTISGLSRIVWSKIQGVGVAKFRLYKSSSIAGPFILFDSTLFSNQSTVIDLTTPFYKAYYYLIKSVDSCGNESTESGVHRPIKGGAFALGNGVNYIYWDNYLGSSFAISKFILRSINGGPFVTLSQLSLINKNSYYDTITPTGTIRYLIELTQSISCTPGTGNNIRILSNVITALPGGILEHDEATAFEVYPNPTSGSLNISTKNTALFIESVEIVNILGSTVKKQYFSGLNHEATVDMDGLADGVYYLMITSNRIKTYPVKVILNRGK